MSMTYDDFRKLGLAIDMTRGKPSPAQLDLSSDALVNCLQAGEFMSRDGIDCRNYGYPLGLPEAREFGADLLGVVAEQVRIGLSVGDVVYGDHLDGAVGGPQQRMLS